MDVIRAERTTCALCGGPSDPQESRVAFMPKWWAHERCVAQAGVPLETLDAQIACCSARRAMAMFAGCVVQRDARVPMDEIWFVDPAARSTARWTLGPGGRIEMVEMPVGAPPPAGVAEGNP